MIRHARERMPAWVAARAAAGDMLLALDFDGTLAPIVPHPEDAAILAAARNAIGALAARGDTRVAIVSGRALADVRARVGIPSIYYAGNHGLEIEGPGLRRVLEEAERARPALAECARRVAALEREYAGVFLEDKRLSLSLHYRNLPDPSDETGVVRRVHELCAGIEGVRLTDGKKIVEVRPDVDWDKGRATVFLLDSLLRDAPAAPVTFIGDDRTDEDAFRALGDRGEGVLVADPPPAETAAVAYLRSPLEVADLLNDLARA
jgi:trehalose-phosphatase